jgi:hypothetical protein
MAGLKRFCGFLLEAREINRGDERTAPIGAEVVLAPVLETVRCLGPSRARYLAFIIEGHRAARKLWIGAILFEGLCDDEFADHGGEKQGTQQHW